jgi:hypothetical protein
MLHTAKPSVSYTVTGLLGPYVLPGHPKPYLRSLLLSTIVSDSTARLGVNASVPRIANFPLFNGHSECNVVGSALEDEDEASERSFRTRNMLRRALTDARCSAI